jgi:hypothetical protein
LRSTLAEGDKLDDAAVLAVYRLKLFGKGSEPKRGDPNAAKISAEAYRKVLDADGHLGSAERLQTRVSWFTRGAVVGGREFVDIHLKNYRKHKRRREHLHPKPFSKQDDAFAELYTMRVHV